MENPIKKYLEWRWASDAWYFAFYDKEQWERVKYDLQDFSVIKVWYVIKWWSNESNKPIYSNTINNFKEHFTVLTKEWKLFSGKYNKAEIEALWWKLYISITVFTNWETVNFVLKWMAYFNFNELLEKNNWSQARFEPTRWKMVRLEWFEEWKKLAVKFRTPKFVITETPVPVWANGALAEVNAYIDDKQAKFEASRTGQTTSTTNEATTDVDQDNLPF